MLNFHNQDSTVIIDGLTKVMISISLFLLLTSILMLAIMQNWRLPGWRVCWVIGPKNLISALSQSGSFLDGGANHPYVFAFLFFFAFTILIMNIQAPASSHSTP